MTTKVKIANGKTWVGNSEGNAVERAAALLPGEWEVGKVPTSTETVGEFTWGDGGGGGNSDLTSSVLEGYWGLIPPEAYEPTITIETKTLFGSSTVNGIHFIEDYIFDYNTEPWYLYGAAGNGALIRLTTADNTYYLITCGSLYVNGATNPRSVLLNAYTLSGTITKLELFHPYNTLQANSRSPITPVIKIEDIINDLSLDAYRHPGIMYYIQDGTTGGIFEGIYQNFVIGIPHINHQILYDTFVGDMYWAIVNPYFTVLDINKIYLLNHPPSSGGGEGY
ncbi:MAG: hypothetical protein BWY47_00049 [Bacteroidetes bacterium ADurb.Bin302]|nr:MAG: hypothetical protein BWY47_00049 [Bacteroidetes bacterium ADurb.Bin302]